MDPATINKNAARRMGYMAGVEGRPREFSQKEHPLFDKALWYKAYDEAQRDSPEIQRKKIAASIESLTLVIPESVEE